MLQADWCNSNLLSGLVGSLIGGGMSFLGSAFQVKRQQAMVSYERRDAQRREMNSIKFLLKMAKTDNQYAELGLRLRRFFVDNPDRLEAEPSNAEFFKKYLSEISSLVPPAPDFWSEPKTGKMKLDDDLLKP
jgi:hypothetical protein